MEGRPYAGDCLLWNYEIKREQKNTRKNINTADRTSKSDASAQASALNYNKVTSKSRLNYAVTVTLLKAATLHYSVPKQLVNFLTIRRIHVGNLEYLTAAILLSPKHY
jgi:hypothetical protein